MGPILMVSPHPYMASRVTPVFSRVLALQYSALSKWRGQNNFVPGQAVWCQCVVGPGTIQTPTLLCFLLSSLASLSLSGLSPTSEGTKFSTNV